VRLLGDGDWGSVEIKKGRIRVARVASGDEAKLRHYLESVVGQANASQEPPAERPRDRDEDHAEEGLDAEMTQRFRSFAESGPESGPEHELSGQADPAA
jgi:hypothetical protein